MQSLRMNNVEVSAPAYFEQRVDASSHISTDRLISLQFESDRR